MTAYKILEKISLIFKLVGEHFRTMDEDMDILKTILSAADTLKGLDPTLPYCMCIRTPAVVGGPSVLVKKAIMQSSTDLERTAKPLAYRNQ